MKDPVIMLFGKKIVLPGNGGDFAGGEYSGESKSYYNLKHNNRGDGDQRHEKGDVDQTSSEDQNSETITDQEDESWKPIKSQEQNESTNASRNHLKKPDKILPCPRCNSKDTKFCYYNNYNVSQPRHFCKSCQRYWTAGGTMRNVPVGSGRRKNKNSTTRYYRHLTISEALRRIINDPIDGYNHHPEFKINGTVLSFSSDYKIDQRDSFSCGNGVKLMKDCNKTSSTALQSTNGGFQSQVSFGSRVSSPFPWNSQISNNPGILYPGYPVPVYPNRNVPWPCNRNSGPSHDSLLRKHSRDGEIVKAKSSLSDNVSSTKEESSIGLSTLGIKYDSVRRGDLFKSLQQNYKDNDNKQMVKACPLLQANPAALSRAICFRESL